MKACIRGDESEAKSIVEMDPELHNKQYDGYYTELIFAQYYGCHSISRLLLSRPELDTTFRNFDDVIEIVSYDTTALHLACNPGFKPDWDRTGRAQLDIVTRAASTRLSLWPYQRIEVSR